MTISALEAVNIGLAIPVAIQAIRKAWHQGHARRLAEGGQDFPIRDMLEKVKESRHINVFFTSHGTRLLYTHIPREGGGPNQPHVIAPFSGNEHCAAAALHEMGHRLDEIETGKTIRMWPRYLESISTAVLLPAVLADAPNGPICTAGLIFYLMAQLLEGAWKEELRAWDQAMSLAHGHINESVMLEMRHHALSTYLPLTRWKIPPATTGGTT